MYPTLYHAIFDLFGVEIQLFKLLNTFGFMVALAFLGAARCLSLELARKHQAGLMPSSRRPAPPERPTTLFDVFSSGFVAFIIGYKIFGIALGDHALQGGADTQRYLLSTQGHFWGGVATAFGWMLLRARELAPRGAIDAKSGGKAAKKLGNEGEGEAKPEAGPEMIEVTPQDHTVGITGAAALGGLVGAKLFHLLERPRSILEFFENPSLSAIFSGLTIYGGLIVGTLSVWWYSRRAKLPFKHVCDAVAPGLMLAYGIGRLGCQLAGDGDWGIANAAEPPGWLSWLPRWVWSFDYPNNVLGAGVPMAEGGFPGYGTHLVPPVFPTPLYESVAAFSLFALLWALRRRIERPLVMFGLYMMLNGFERFWIEKIRVNATYDLFGLEVTQAELISVAMFIGGAGLIWQRMRRDPAPVAPGAQPSADS